MISSRIIEICAASASDCFEAEAGGAHRVELCSSIPEGGTTPSFGEIKVARVMTSLSIMVMIRPRGGDFLYSNMEFKSMLYDIELAKDLGVDGFAMGCLTSEGDVDTKMMLKLVNAAAPLSITFHRAFDVCRDPFLALEQIIDCGCDRILTSGQAPDAVQGIPIIAELIRRAAGRIVIMPGCGVREHNIGLIESETRASEFHTSARRLQASPMEFRNERVPMSIPGVPEFDRALVDRTLVSRFL